MCQVLQREIFAGVRRVPPENKFNCSGRAATLTDQAELPRLSNYIFLGLPFEGRAQSGWRHPAERGRKGRSKPCPDVNASTLLTSSDHLHTEYALVIILCTETGRLTR